MLWLLLSSIPATVWAILAAIAIVAIILYLPSPIRGYAIAGVVAVAIGTMAYFEGARRERLVWETRINEEAKRLADRFAQQAAAEQKRASEAEALANSYKDTINAIIEDAAESDPRGNDVAIPRSTAQRLWDLHHGTPQ